MAEFAVLLTQRCFSEKGNQRQSDLARHAKYKRPMAEREIRNEYLFPREHTDKSWQWKRTSWCTSLCTAAQMHLSQWPFPPRQTEDFTARVCAPKQNLLTSWVAHSSHLLSTHSFYWHIACVKISQRAICHKLLHSPASTAFDPATHPQDLGWTRLNAADSAVRLKSAAWGW